MRVVIKVQRDDGTYLIEECNVSDHLDPSGVMMTKEQMMLSHMFRRLYGAVQAMPPKKEMDEL